MKDTKKAELFDDMLKKFDIWQESYGQKARKDYEEAVSRYADYVGCSIKHAFDIAWMD